MDIKSIALSYFTQHQANDQPPYPLKANQSRTQVSDRPATRYHPVDKDSEPDPYEQALSSFAASLRSAPAGREGGPTAGNWANQRAVVSAAPTRAPPPPPPLAPPTLESAPTQIGYARKSVRSPRFTMLTDLQLGVQGPDPLDELHRQVNQLVAYTAPSSQSPTHLPGPLIGILSRQRRAAEVPEGAFISNGGKKSAAVDEHKFAGIAMSLVEKLNLCEQAITHHQNLHISERASLQVQVDKASARADECDFKGTEVAAVIEGRLADIQAHVKSRMATSSQLRENWLVKAKNAIVTELRTATISTYSDANASQGAFRQGVEELQELIRQYQGHADAKMTSLQVALSTNLLHIQRQLKEASYLTHRLGAVGSTLAITGAGQEGTEAFRRLPMQSRSAYDPSSVKGVGGLQECESRFLEIFGAIRAELTKLRIERVKFESHFLDRIAQLQLTEGHPKPSRSAK